MDAPPRGRRHVVLVVLALAEALAVVLPYSAFTYLFLAVAVAAFGVVLFGGTRASSGIVAVLGVVALLSAAFAPYRFSRDIAAYTDYGAMVARHHASPYVSVPSDFPDEPAFRAMNPSFHGARSVYGPLFTGASAVIVAIAGRSLLAARLLFQFLEALGVALAGWLVWRRSRDPATLACVILNPVLVVSVVNGGHNDALVGLGILAAVLLARDRVGWAGAAIGLAALVKVTALLPGAALFVWLMRRNVRHATVFAVSAAAVTVAGFALAGGLAPIRALKSVSLLVSYPSFWTWIREHAAATDVRAWSGIVVVAVVVLLVAPRIRRPDTEDAVAGSAAAYLLGAAYVLPWYGAWIIPVDAMHRRRAEHALVLSFTALLFLAYFPVSTNVAPAVRVVRNGFVQAMRIAEIPCLIALAAWGMRRPADARLPAG